MPLSRLGEPAEIAATAVFIAENDFVTGRVIEVDGGLRLDSTKPHALRPPQVRL